MAVPKRKVSKARRDKRRSSKMCIRDRPYKVGSGITNRATGSNVEGASTIKK